MKTAEEILLDCFLGVIDFNEQAAIAAMHKYASQQLELQADNYRNEVAIKIDMLRQQHEAEMVELAEWINNNELYQGTDDSWYNPERFEYDEDGTCIKFPVYAETTTELLAQFRSNNGGHG